MKRFRNILVVYDQAIGGDDALEQALALALQNKARLTLATVLREGQLSAGVADEAAKRLQRVAASLNGPSNEACATAVLIGTPFLEIIRQVLRDNHDLVVASAEAGRVLRDVFFGSTATHLMRKCPCPIWVVKPGQDTPYTSILAAVDLQNMDTNNELNIKIMDLATSLASRDGATLHVVHAWEVEGNDAETLRSEMSPDQRQALIEQHRVKHESALSQFMSRYPLYDIDVRIHLPRETPAKAIGQLADQEKIDLIVMGTLAQTGTPGLFIGDTAELVLASVKCGMLTAKPDSFKTPVTLPEAGLPDIGNSEASKSNVRQLA